jgi:hypothetical protein
VDAIGWLTAALAGVTAWMAKETRRMANETRRMAEVASETLAFEQRPYLALVNIKAYPGDPTNPVLRPIIVWENKGRVLIHFKVELVEVVAQTSVPSSPALKGAEGVAFPGVRVEFEGPTIAGIDVNKFWRGSLHFKVSYGTAADHRNYIGEEWLDLFGGTDRGGERYVNWTRTKAPNYT